MEKKQLVPLVIETFNTISRQDSENIVADSFNNVSYPVHSSEVINEINEEEKVVSKSNKIVKLVPKSVTQPFTNEELINIGKSFSLRLITKFEWLEKRKEYLLLLKQQTILFHQQKQLISRPDSSPDYTPNILLRFSGVCSGTNRDILLTLFRKIARVEYIDLKRKSDDTHVIRNSYSLC